MTQRPRAPVVVLAGCLLLAPGGWLGEVVGKGVEPRIETLDNGLKLILIERHEQPMLAGCVVYDVGSVNDPRGQSGIAHLFEHMLFKGSKIIGTTDYASERPLIAQQEELRERMNAEMNRMRVMKRRGQIKDVLDPAEWTPKYTAMKKEFDEMVEKQRPFIKNNELFNLYTTNGGAGLNAGTAEDFTIYFVKLPANKLELFFWLESDRMTNGVMREFYIERDNVREERRLRTESTPTGKFREAFNALFWQSHPYGIPVIGWPSEVESITSQDVRDFYKIYYAPNNAKIVLVGDFDSDQALEYAKKYFGRIPRGAHLPTPVITEEPKPISERRLNAEAETNPRVQIRFHGVAIGHTDEAALDVAAQLLSGKSGRLYKRLVAKEEAAMGQPFASNTARKYAGYFGINATVKEGHEPEAVEAMILEELATLRDGEITDYELQKVKNQVMASSVQRLRSNTGLMFQLALYDTWYKWEYINESPEQMLAVTADDVQRVLRDYFDPKTRTVAIYRTKAGTASEDPELSAALEEVPAEAREQIKAAIKKIKASDDLIKLNAQVEMMERGLASGEAPEQQKAALKLMVQAVKARIVELEAGSKESN
ncbi:MAG: insulinase family protein [Planctomycetes bacterium]|nr:insulinase family protein [Planctomycetota bacterium]